MHKIKIILILYSLLVITFFIPRTYVIKNKEQSQELLRNLIPGIVYGPTKSGQQKDEKNSGSRSEKMATIGIASWYDYNFGAAGQHCAPDQNCTTRRFATCASRSISRGKRMRVRSLQTRKWVDCLVTDYGPAQSSHRIVDLSSYAFQQLAPLSQGIVEVEVSEVIK